MITNCSAGQNKVKRIVVLIYKYEANYLGRSTVKENFVLLIFKKLFRFPNLGSIKLIDSHT